MNLWKKCANAVFVERSWVFHAVTSSGLKGTAAGRTDVNTHET